MSKCNPYLAETPSTDNNRVIMLLLTNFPEGFVIVYPLDMFFCRNRSGQSVRSSPWY